MILSPQQSNLGNIYLGISKYLPSPGADNLLAKSEHFSVDKKHELFLNGETHRSTCYAMASTIENGELLLPWCSFLRVNYP